MYALATCTASVLRGTGVNVYGDEIDGGAAVYTGVLAAIREVSSVVSDPSTQTPRTVRSLICHVPSDLDVREGDRLRDDTNSVLYAIENVTHPQGPGVTRDTVLDLQRVT